MSKARILVIDDQLYFRSYTEGMLEEDGYAVETADGGLRGLEILEQEGPFDVVLTDLIMPGIDGIETVRRIRERFPDQVVVVVTGVGDVRSAVDALRVGAAEYLLKPVDRDDLVHTIQSLLEQRRLREEHERLLNENLAFLGFVSAVDRGLGLLGRSTREDLAPEVLELFCKEARAGCGLLWARDPSGAGDGFSLLARVGDVGEGGDRTLPEPSTPQWELLRQGRLVVDGKNGTAGGVLWVPCSRDGTIWAVARLTALSSDGVTAEVRGTCAKLGEIAAIAFDQTARAVGPDHQTLRDASTGLHTLEFLRDATDREIHRGQRYGRPFVILHLEVGNPAGPDLSPEQARRLASAVEGTLRPAEVIASEGSRRCWVLAPESDTLASVVVKGRLIDAVRGAFPDLPVAMGVANFPTDGESFETLAATVRTRLEQDRGSLLHSLGLSDGDSLQELATRLRYQAEFMPDTFVTDVFELILDEIRSRPDMRGLVFVAPGAERAGVFSELSGLGRRPFGTELFVATDGDTVPVGGTVKAIPLPRGLPSDTTWLVRFGEAPPYVLVAGPATREGSRPVFHSHDRSLVEYAVSRLRTEIGFGMGARV